MFEPFTAHARRIPAIAEQEAAALHHDQIGSGHLLLALLRIPDGTAAKVLSHCGVDYHQAKTAVGDLQPARQPPTDSPQAVLATVGIDLDEVRRAAEDSFGPGSLRFPRVRFSPEAKAVLQYAADEAIKLSHFEVGTGHLLLGLLAKSQTTAGLAIASFRIDPANLRAAIIGQIAPAVARARAEIGRAHV